LSDRCILVAEDNEGDIFLIREALQPLEIPLHIVSDGEEAIAFLDRSDAGEAPCPVLALLDLNLPKQTGHEVLERYRRSPRYGQTPVVVVTSSEYHGDIAQAWELGATCYFRKPSDYDEFMKLGEIVRDLLAGNPVPDSM
jgi:chemotaxis family two-component system response regulator Rcp1